MEKAIEIALQYGACDGEHHKAWVIDQMLRALLGKSYCKTIKDWCNGENGPKTYEWDVGIPP